MMITLLHIATVMQRWHTFCHICGFCMDSRIPYQLCVLIRSIAISAVKLFVLSKYDLPYAQLYILHLHHVPSTSSHQQIFHCIYRIFTMKNMLKGLNLHAQMQSIEPPHARASTWYHSQINKSRVQVHNCKQIAHFWDLQNICRYV